MQSHAKILGQTSFKEFNPNGYSPIEKLYMHLMAQKAKHIYPDKIELANLQLKLIKIAKTIRERSKDPKQTEPAISELQQLQNKSREIIKVIHQKDDEFAKYSQKSINNAKAQTLKNLNTLMQDIETILGKKIPQDIKALLLDSKGEPINSEKLDQIVKERVNTRSDNE